MFRLAITPFFCRTRYQKSLAKLLQKAKYRLHRELDIGHFLKKIRDSRNLVLSFAQSKTFNPDTLYRDYQNHYTNTIQISLETDGSIEQEFADPLPVEYKDPQPVCVCPDLGEDNIVKIAETAYNILKTETELNHQMNESLKKKKAAVDNTMEGGTSDRSSRDKSFIPITFTKLQEDEDATPKKFFPVIMHPPETDAETVAKLAGEEVQIGENNAAPGGAVGDKADDILSEHISPRQINDEV